MTRYRVLASALVISAATLVSIASHEGYVEVATPPVKGDVPTNGFGATKGVKEGDRTNPVRALIRLNKEAEEHAEAVRRCAPVPLYQHEFDAYVSLTYNIGQGAFCKSSIPSKLMRGDYEAACRTILDFDGFRDRSKPQVFNAKTGNLEYPLVRLRGLTLRRQAEYKQCMGES